MVEDQFAILKVGPALTFAFREAVFALEMIEQEWLGGRQGPELSDLRRTLEQAMSGEPVYWTGYYLGRKDEIRFSRMFSWSDRVRYYWPVPEVEAALQRLLGNLSTKPVPMSLLSQFLPVQFALIREGLLPENPRAWIHHKIQSVLSDYAFACGMTRETV
jgi:D-tagatose-1,6-bisphosphate aldolase subunit GatZ/KbaZ